MRKTPLLAALTLAASLLSAPAQAAETYPFQNPALPLEQRVEDLLGRLTLDEKLSLLHQSQPAIPRLGIAYHKNGTEALHGVAWSNHLNDNWNQKFASGTVFPQALGLASTWDPALIKKVGSAVGDETRGYNAVDPVLWGLQVWAPVVDLLRDPRAGRNEEGYSEDPLLTGAISTAYGKGLQGDDPFYLKTAPVLKHYLAYNNETNRSLTSSNLTPKLKHEYYEPAFKAAISADAATGVMASYNLVNGRPNHVNPDLNDVVRSWTDKTLYNPSDAWGPHALTDLEHYYDNKPEAFAAVLKAGLDSFTIDNSDISVMVTNLKAALDQGLLTEADVDKSVRSVLSIRTRLGHFDPDGGPYKKIGADVINSEANKRLNRETAGKAAVLLKNSGVLPLAKPKSAAVVGPLSAKLYRDWYSGQLPYQVTPLDGIKERVPGVTTGEGLERIALKHLDSGKYVTATGTGPNDNATLADTAPTAASQWDLTDWTGGVSTLRNAGNGMLLGGDWRSLDTDDAEPDGWYVSQQFALEKQADGSHLIRYAGYETVEGWFALPDAYVGITAEGALGLVPKAQAAKFAKEVVSDGVAAAAAQAAKAEVAVVVVGSHPFVAGREFHDRDNLRLGEGQRRLIEAVRKANPRTVVVLETSYPVIVDAPTLLWTTHAGAETGHAIADVLFGDVNPGGRLTQTWPATDELPSLLDYDLTKTGMTYLYGDDKPLYAFGHGLSYTSFAYQGLRAQGERVSVKVTNTGRVRGDEVVQLYTHQRESRFQQPVKQLRGFQRVTLNPGQSRTVTFTLKKSDLAVWDHTRDKWTVENATHDLLVGSASDRIRQSTTLRVSGETVPVRDLTKVTRAMDFDDYSGVAFADESKVRGEVVEGSAGDWVSYTGASWGSRLTASVASVGGGSFEVRRGSPTGALLATVQVPATGGIYQYGTVNAAVKAGTGSVYLVFKGDLRIKDFAFTRS
ncbi:glycoside hydrolase family 3 C-terminal domain-containing protein [Nonomuraea gerenzanensis]|uniref:Exo-alpha-(1->6)-L-arabinopyranosidase n=1 Tax=Nonomuraea gerenzanensis TaxID=93944 RepID=A0A1M4E0C7_9ACTN|nr:glycoside hydrolase family 3 C-terminal domain-containing protein [Nonomuraea gerenzanensis]UBU14533.1 glycoside hydrolase family 3 C-terminal domain-containing protein [Nonomuraea gerenzanensis]SBO92250.1 Beta-glucosidase [Nonomuraea gerenzanensis]